MSPGFPSLVGDTRRSQQPDYSPMEKGDRLLFQWFLRIGGKPSPFTKKHYPTTLFLWLDLSVSNKNLGTGIETVIFPHSYFNCRPFFLIYSVLNHGKAGKSSQGG